MLVFYTFLTCISPSLNWALLLLCCPHSGTSLLALRVDNHVLPETDTHLTWELVLGWVCCIAGPRALGSCPAVGGDNVVAAAVPPGSEPRCSISTCTRASCATKTSRPLCFREFKEQGLVPQALFRGGKRRTRSSCCRSLSRFTAAMYNCKR